MSTVDCGERLGSSISYTSRKAGLPIFTIFLLYIASYDLLNIDRVISKVEVRKDCEAGTIHRWFTGALLLC